MRKITRFTEEQIIQVLKEADGTTNVKEICGRHGISPATPIGERSLVEWT